MKKRILTLTLALLLVLGSVVGLSSCGGTKSALPDAKDASETVGGVTWTYTADTKTLRLSGAGAIPNADSADAISWKAVRHSVEKVEFAGDFTEIGNYAFYYFTKLKSISLPATVTRLGDQAFAFCDELATIEIPESVTTIGDSCFESCSALTTVQVPKNVSFLGANAFSHCASLKVVRILGKIDAIRDNTFRECKSLHTVAYNAGIAPESISASAFLGANANAWIGKLPNEAGDVTLTINYVKTDGTPIQLAEGQSNPYVITLKVGDDFNVESPTVTDFVVVGANGEALKDKHFYNGTIRENITHTVTYKEKAAETTAPSDTSAGAPAAPAEEDEIGVAEIIAIVAFVVVIAGIIVVVILMMRSDKKKAPKNNGKNSKKK